MSSDNAILGVATTGGVAATAAATTATTTDTTWPMWLLIAACFLALFAFGFWLRKRSTRS